MTIEFRCGQCNQLLRVPDTAAGKNARCPNCQAVTMAPAGSVAASPPMDASGFGGGPPSVPPPDHPFGETAAGHPFGDQVASINPYASPASAGMLPNYFAMAPISPRPVAADAVFNYAWAIWKANLGLLVGITVIQIAVSYAIALPFGAAQAVLEQQQEKEIGIAVTVLAQIINNLVQLYLGIGMAQIALKLARRQPASFGDLFGGLPRMLPLIGAWLIAVVPMLIGFLLLIVPGVILLLMFWPAYYLIVDGRAGVIESFSVAKRVTEGNWGSAFVIYMMSIAISLLGCAAICVGLVFALPLVSVMWAVAYLMMSGQLMPYGPGHPELLGPPPVGGSPA